MHAPAAHVFHPAVELYKSHVACMRALICKRATQANACVVVVLVGLAMMIPSLLVMLWFDDSQTLGIHSEAVTCAAPSPLPCVVLSHHASGINRDLCKLHVL